MRIAVTGGRDLKNWQQICDELDVQISYGDQMIVGDCPTGLDLIASVWFYAKYGMVPGVFKADWDKHGKAAGPMRNRDMMTDGEPDLLVAFPGGRGTASAVREAKKAGVEVYVRGQT